MTTSLTYASGAELPDLTLSWRDSFDELIDFSTGYVFTVKIGVPGSAAIVTKTTGITGAETDPNVTIAWATLDELIELPAGDYVIQVVATRTTDAKDRHYPYRIGLTILSTIT